MYCNSVVFAILPQPHPPSSDAPKLLDHCSHLQLEGNMHCFAYVHSRATCGEATAVSCTPHLARLGDCGRAWFSSVSQAIKQDVARSLLTRVDTLCKSLEAEKLEKSDENSGTIASE